MNIKIYSSVPVNKLAGIVTGIQPNDDIKGGNYTKQVYMSKAMPETIPFISKRHWLNLTGLTFGKLTVIGLFAKQNPKKKLKWVVQCKCGYYTTRTSQTIRRKIKNNVYDECHRCQYISDLSKRQQHYFQFENTTQIN